MRPSGSGEQPRVLYVDASLGFGGAIKSLALTLRGLPHADSLLLTSQDPEIVAAWFGGLAVRPFRRVVNYRTKERVAASMAHPLARRAALKGFAAADLLVERANAAALTRSLRGGRYDLVHLNNGFLPREALLAARRADVPCVVHLRDFQHDRAALDDPVARAVARVIAVSDAVSRSLDGTGYPAERRVTVHDPVDLELVARAAAARDRVRAECGLAAEDVAVGIFGRVIQWKGQLEFARAAIEAMRDRPRLRAVIVGDESDGPREYMDRVRAIAASSGFDDRFSFVGYRANVEEWYAAMDLVVHASITPEPFGMVVPEAMAAGRAVIAADAGGPREVITPGGDGLLVPPGDVGALARAIVTLSGDAALRARMGAAGREAAHARFGIEANAARIAAIHRAVLAEHGRRG